jgi:hypothetical protein
VLQDFPFFLEDENVFERETQSEREKREPPSNFLYVLPFKPHYPLGAHNEATTPHHRSSNSENQRVTTVEI